LVITTLCEVTEELLESSIHNSDCEIVSSSVLIIGGSVANREANQSIGSCSGQFSQFYFEGRQKDEDALPG
jgi:hypothetical protein